MLGLTIEELRILDEQLYGKDYLEKNLYDSLDFFTVKKKKSRKIAHSCTYFIPDEEELNIKEKKSIEEDLSSPNAFIYIEDINAIKRLLAISRESKKEVFEQIEVKKVDPIVEEEVNKELKNEATKKYAKIFDITDKVVIIDDELDVDRFVKEFPTEKQGSVKKLMRYLDGLFEKLPENTIRKFADSEYYDLYIQVLNDLGV